LRRSFPSDQRFARLVPSITRLSSELMYNKLHTPMSGRVTQRLAPSTPLDDATAGRGTPATILVVEDDDDTRASVAELLEGEGYQVVAARHGREAQTFLRHGPRPDCMVLDLWMPEMDGWTLTAEMKRGRLPLVPTIIVTAAEPHWGYPGPIVIRKPLDSDRLLTLVRAMVPAPAGRDPVT
jgi:PleD family two-component response regulator